MSDMIQQNERGIQVTAAAVDPNATGTRGIQCRLCVHDVTGYYAGLYPDSLLTRGFQSKLI